MLSLALAITIAIHSANVFGPPAAPAIARWTDDAPRGARAITVDGAGGTKLRGWLVPVAADHASYVVYFYGSNEDVAIEASRLVWLTTLGVNAVCVDYRGYGFSDGRPDGAAIRDDALRVFDAVAKTIAPPGARIFVYGWSVGTQMALHVAASRPVAGVILQAPPASADAMDAASRRADVPAIVRWAVRLKSDDAVRRIYQGAAEARSVTAPLLVVEGTADKIVPPAQARAVLDAAGSVDKRIVFVAGAGHNDLRYRDPPASTAVAAFLHTH